MIEILNISKELASDSLIEERLEDALDQLRVAFSFGIKIYGEKSFKLIELFGFMTDTFIRMGLLSKAVEQHKKAEIIIKDPENDCPADKDIIMADFYKHEGFIHQAQLNFTESLRSFANEVYYATMAFNPEHIRVAMGLFHLGQTFAKLDKHEIAFTHFIHTIDIWLAQYHKELKHLIERVITVIGVTDIGHENHHTSCTLSLFEKNTSQFTIQFIREYFDKQVEASKRSKINNAKITCVNGMVDYFFGHFEKAGKLALKTKVILHECKDNHLSEAAKDLHRMANKAMHKKDFKSVGKQFKNMANFRKSKDRSLDECLQKHAKTARKRTAEWKDEKQFGRMEKRQERNNVKRKSRFGDDGYSLDDGKIKIWNEPSLPQTDKSAETISSENQSVT